MNYDGPRNVLGAHLPQLVCSRRDCTTYASVICDGWSLCLYHAHERYQEREAGSYLEATTISGVISELRLINAT